MSTALPSLLGNAESLVPHRQGEPIAASTAEPIVAPPWKPALDGLEKFDEGDRATWAAYLALLLTGLVGAGLVGAILAIDVAIRPGGLPIIHVDHETLGLALLAIFLGIFAIPKWGSKWAQPIVPEGGPPSEPKNE